MSKWCLYRINFIFYPIYFTCILNLLRFVLRWLASKWPDTRYLYNLASSRGSASWGAVRKTTQEKSTARGSKRTLVGKLNKRSFRVHQDVLYPLIGEFWQILSSLEHYRCRSDILCRGGQRPFSEWCSVQICDKQHAKRFSPSGVPSWRREGLYENMVIWRCLHNPSQWFWIEFNLSTLSISNVWGECKSWCLKLLRS